MDTRVYRRPNCVQQDDRFGGGSVMVWAGIHQYSRTALVHVTDACGIRYLDEILHHHVIPRMNVNSIMFQHDNARPRVFTVPQRTDITCVSPFAGFKPTSTSMGCSGSAWISVDAGGIHLT